MINVFKPSITEREIEAVASVLRSGWLGLGPKTAEFEHLFSDAMRANHAVALNSGTAALHLALHLHGIEPGDEVLVPPITFASTAQVVMYFGAKPVFVDVEPDTFNVDASDVARKIGPKTRGIIVVHYGGHPCDMDEINEIAFKNGLFVIEDAAHACGAAYRGRPVGSISEVTCFSFHAVKNLTTGEGGMITTSNGAFDARLRRLRWMGINRDTWDRTAQNETYAWRYSVEEIGYKYHMSDIAAALGIVQLDRLDELNSRRRDLVERYNRAFAGLAWVETPIERPYVRSSWHIYRIMLDRREEMIGHLKSRGIAPGVHYYPLHLYSCFAGLKADVPVADRVWRRALSLPLYPDLTDDEQDRVVEAVVDYGRANCL